MLPRWKLHVYSEPYIKIATEALEKRGRQVVKFYKSPTKHTPERYTLIYEGKEL